MMYDELVKRLRDDEAWKNCDFDFIYDWMHQAADAIEELSKPRWIPVTERLPEENVVVLVFGGKSIYTAYYGKSKYGGGLVWHKLNSKNHYCNPTHWMPLPELPKEEAT
jgi:hypothetical protein